MNEIDLTRLQTGIMFLCFFGGVICGIIIAAIAVHKETSGTKKKSRPGNLNDLEDTFVPREKCSNCGTPYSRSFSSNCPICKHYEIHN